MTTKKLNWDSTDGYRSLRWGNTVGGLIDTKPAWQIWLPKGMFDGQVLILGDRCYAMDDRYTLHALELNSGEEIWNLVLENNGYLGLSYFKSTEKYLHVGSYVIDAEKGKLVDDLSHLTGDIDLSEGEPSELHNGKIYSQINSEHSPGKILVLEPESGSAEMIDIGMVALCMPEDYITYGWKRINDDYILTGYDFRNSETWTVNPDVKLGRLSAENHHLLVMNPSEITLLDLNDGSKLWTRETETLMDSLDPQQVYSFDVCMCEDTIGLFHCGHFVQLNRFNGNKLWELEFDGNIKACIVGDLIYAVHGKNNNNKVICALDRYNSEVLWSQESGLSINSVKAKDNRVLFVGFNGEILCYEWDENKPYNSLDKDKMMAGYQLKANEVSHDMLRPAKKIRVLSEKQLGSLKSMIDNNQIDELKNTLDAMDSHTISQGLLYSDQTIFMYACQHGTPEAVNCFMDKNVAFSELKYGDSTEFKCAAQNEKHAYPVLSILLNGLDKELAKELLESNGDPYLELEGEGDGLTPIDILKANNDKKSLDLVKEYLE